MKKLLLGSIMVVSMLAVAGCSGKVEEPDTTGVITEEVQEVVSDVSESQPEEETETKEDSTWADQNELEYTTPKEVEMPWYCYQILNGEKLEDITNRYNKAIYSKPIVTVEETGDMKTYSVTYTVEASNTFVIPDSYASTGTDSWQGQLNDYELIDPYTGTVIPFSYDENEYEVAVPQGDETCQITTSGSMKTEEKKADSITGEEWLFEVENVYTFNLKITVPKDNNDITLWLSTIYSTEDGDEGDSDNQPVPHIFGEKHSEVKDACIFIKLADLVTE